MKKKRILVTGATGLLGSAILRFAEKRFVLAGTYHKVTLVPNVLCKYFKVDITKKKTIEAAVRVFKPDYIVHTAALATPDYCDKHPEEAHETNVVGTQNVADVAKQYGVHLIFITTNGVYDGKHAPYDESAEVNPIDVYGKTKVAGEEYVEKNLEEYSIVRLITMYGWNNPRQRQNPVTWQNQILGENKLPINMVNDMYNNFLFSDEAARAVLATIESGLNKERFNVAGSNCISRYDFSVAIAKTFGHDASMITPVSLSFFKNFVPRPKNTCFITAKMQRKLGQKPMPISRGLLAMKKNPPKQSWWKELE